jgi:transcription antitermination protein NusB
MSTRHSSREYALKALFALDFMGFPEKQLSMIDYFPAVSEEERKAVPEETAAAVQILVSGTLERLEEIDTIISTLSRGRALERIERVDRCILRLSIYQMLYQKSVPAAVVIDEAVKLSLEYSSNVNYKFINGLLDTFRKERL